jgi:myo-inositol 2-dehydrogenase/D-chiro-inositol 1-dehydrogenase
MAPLRYGLIGAGMMGHEHIRNIALIPDAQVVAAADPDDAMRTTAQALAGPGCRAYTNHADMLSDGGLDALVIVAPNHLHHPILMEVLPYNLPILCEKPLGVTVDQCREIIQLAQTTTAPVWVAMEYRYMPPVEALRAELNRGTAGRLRMLSIREHRFPFLHKVGDWNRFNAQTGGTLVEKCCHFFDLMRLVIGATPTRIYASGAADVNFRDELYDGRTPDILDNAYVIVDFDNGCRAMLDLCMFAEGSYWQEVISATGDAARIDAMIPGPARFTPDGQERRSQIVISDRASKTEDVRPIEVDHSILSAGDHHGSTFFQHLKFAELVRHGGTPEVSLTDGLISVIMGAAAEESARTGRAITLNPDWMGA